MIALRLVTPILVAGLVAYTGAGDAPPNAASSAAAPLPVRVEAVAGPLAPLPAPVFAAADVDEDLARLEAARELDPDDPTTLEAYSAALGKKGDVDGQVAFLMLALDAYEKTEVDDVAAKEKTLKRLGELLSKTDGEVSALREARNDYVKNLAWALQLYAVNQRKYWNALEVAGRILIYRPDHSLARQIVDDIKKRPDPALVAEANRLSSLRELTRPRAFLVKWAEEHRDWSQAGTVETDGYVVKSNIGYDVLQLAGRGLDQISRFYGSFFGADRAVQEGKTTVILTRTRQEWVDVSETPELTDNEGVLAFIRTSPLGESAETLRLKFDVYGYDPRDVARPLESLWPTLWHEASHQYLNMRTYKYHAPAWMNEGMATYFEGARLESNGEISVGLPATERLNDLMMMLEAGIEPLDALLKVKGLLPGELYSPAWGLVYYLQHATGTPGKPRPRDMLSNAVKITASRQVTGEGVFKEAVLTPMGMSLQEFEAQWKQWIQDLHRREESPRTAADAFLAAGDAALAAGRLDEAWEAYQDALLRMPRDPASLLGLARVQKARSDKNKKDDALKDSTLTYARRAHHAALEQENADVEKKASEIATGVDGAGFKKIADAEKSYRRSVENLIKKKVEGGRPRTAIALAGRYLDDVLGGTRRHGLAAELRASETLALERTLRVFDGKTLDGLSAPPRFVSVEDGELVCKPGDRPRRAPVYVEQPLAPLFRVEGQVWLADPNTVLAFNLSQPGQVGSRGFALRPSRSDEEKAPDKEYMPFDLLKYGQVGEMQEAFSRQTGVYDLQLGKVKRLSPKLEAGTWVTFSFAREEPDWLSIRIDGNEVATRKLSTMSDSSSVGLLIYGGEVRIKDLRVVEIDRL